MTAPVMLFPAVEAPSEIDTPSTGLLAALGTSGPLRSAMEGGAWLPSTLGTYQLIDPCDPDPDPFPEEDRPRLVLASPVTLRTRWWWQGRPQNFDAEVAAERAMAYTSAAVTRELWSGEGTRDTAPVGVPSALGGGTHTNDYLANPDTCSVAAGPALDPVHAIAALDGLGQRVLLGSVTPIIHVTPEVAQAAAQHLTQRGSTLRTINGSVVVADAGATGEGPGGASGLWGYVTGPVGVWLSDISSSTDTSDTFTSYLNRQEVWANRSFMVGFDPTCHIAVPIDFALPALTAPTGGTP